MPSESNNVKLLSSFRIEPEKLIVAGRSLPLDNRNYVPIMIFDRPFTKVKPTFTVLGDGAINMAVGQPFGFMQTVGESPLVIETQKTDGIILTPSRSESNAWLASFKTEEPLTEFDLSLFTSGLRYYATYAEARLIQCGIS